jgi:mycothiol synthase
VSRELGASIETALTVSAHERAEVEAIDRAAAVADGVSALDDQVRLDLQYGDGNVRHLLARVPGGDAVIGYAHLRFTDASVLQDARSAVERPDRTLTLPAPPVGHLLVDPLFRRNGVGTALLARIQAAAPAGVRLWAHGDLPAARALAERAGMNRTRELWRMERELTTPLAAPSYPTDVTVRPFEVGVDEALWLTVNALAFADHPEQATVSADGLAQRMAQPDFDPAGFFLAERNGNLVGFHWTKVHPAGDLSPRPVGEVYVLGVHPGAQGLGLGKALTLTGLRYLQSRGLSEVVLYVERDNAAAVAMYTRLGFTRAAVDVVYATPSPTGDR